MRMFKERVQTDCTVLYWKIFNKYIINNIYIYRYMSTIFVYIYIHIVLPDANCECISLYVLPFFHEGPDCQEVSDLNAWFLTFKCNLCTKVG